MVPAYIEKTSRSAKYCTANAHADAAAKRQIPRPRQRSSLRDAIRNPANCNVAITEVAIAEVAIAEVAIAEVAIAESGSMSLCHPLT